MQACFFATCTPPGTPMPWLEEIKGWRRKKRRNCFVPASIKKRNWAKKRTPSLDQGRLGRLIIYWGKKRTQFFSANGTMPLRKQHSPKTFPHLKHPVAKFLILSLSLSRFLDCNKREVNSSTAIVETSIAFRVINVTPMIDVSPSCCLLLLLLLLLQTKKL